MAVQQGYAGRAEAPDIDGGLVYGQDLHAIPAIDRRAFGQDQLDGVLGRVVGVRCCGGGLRGRRAGRVIPEALHHAARGRRSPDRAWTLDLAFERQRGPAVREAFLPGVAIAGVDDDVNRRRIATGVYARFLP